MESSGINHPTGYSEEPLSPFEVIMVNLTNGGANVSAKYKLNNI